MIIPREISIIALVCRFSPNIIVPLQIISEKMLSITKTAIVRKRIRENMLLLFIYEMGR
jgi:hypothetical protein